MYGVACNHAWDGKEKVMTAQENMCCYHIKVITAQANMVANKLFTNIH